MKPRSSHPLRSPRFLALLGAVCGAEAAGVEALGEFVHALGGVTVWLTAAPSGVAEGLRDRLQISWVEVT